MKFLIGKFWQLSYEGWRNVRWAIVWNKRYRKRLWELRGEKLQGALFFIGFMEEFFHVGWINLVQLRLWVLVGPFLYFWQSFHDIYYTIPYTVWQDPGVRRAEKLGSALGGMLTTYLFYMNAGSLVNK